MRLVQLDLLAFGPFTDDRLEFGAQRRLHLVYGPNEAGKSSTLRALRNLLFGIPSNTTDHFLHPHGSLRIGATLVDEDGNRTALLRRKGTKNTLLQSDGKTPLDEGVLEGLLGGMSQNVFDTMFGIDHDELVAGGKAIIQGGGELGQILFAAGAGIANLQAIQKALEAEAEKLFNPRGRNPKINAALTQLEATRKEIKELSLPSTQWVEHDETLRRALARLMEVDDELSKAQRQSNRLQRVRDALPLIVRRRELREQLAGLGRVRFLPADFADRRMQAAARLATARDTEQRCAAAMEELSAEIERLVVPEELLALADQESSLRDQFAVLRKAQSELPSLEAGRAQGQAEAESILRSLRRELTLEQAEGLRLSKTAAAEISRLGNQYEALLGAQERAQADIEELSIHLATAEKQLRAQPPARSAAGLQEVVQRWLEQGDLEKQAAAQQASLAAAERQAEIDLARLPLWSGTLAELEQLAVPADESLDRFERTLAEVEEQLARVHHRAGEVTEQRAENQRQIEKLQLEGAVLTEEDLTEARARRDEAWHQLRSAWQAAAASGQKQFLFAVEHPDASEAGRLVANYEQLAQAADHAADRLRREARRVADLASYTTARANCDRQLDGLKAQQEQLAGQHAVVLQQWEALWKPLGITPATPREMRSWLQRQHALVAEAQRLRQDREALAVLQGTMDICREEVRRALQAVGHEASTDSTSLAALLGQARAVIRQLDTQAVERQRLGEEVAALTAKRALAVKKAEQAEQKFAQWREQWTRAMTPLGLTGETTPYEANHVQTQINELLARLAEVRDKADRIEQIGREAEQFEQHVRRLAQSCAPELVGKPLEACVEELLTRLRQAISHRDRRKSLEQQLQRQRSEREAALRQRTEASALLQAMCVQAGCDQFDQLPEAERLSAEATRLRENLENLDEQLRSLAAGVSIEQFIADAEACEADDLPGQLSRLAETIRRGQAEQAQLYETVGRQREALQKMDGNATAAERNEQFQEILAQIEADVEHYTRLRLAWAVLRDAVQHYREQNEGPVLRRAGEYFARLTLGSFEGLRADFDDRGEAVLVGVRAGGKELVSIQAMSEGTCDQLYLALRLAGLELWLEKHEPLPLVVDDILVNFDDDRSLAALQALAELARNTQVIFFTHHQHLLSLAEAHLPAEVLQTHRLPGRVPAEGHDDQEARRELRSA